ncbi:MAG: Ig-like domain-containing protein [Paracoccaceae bacterium]|nr:Ig-like domain-containing protein [Paracoccaceae bacterium]
MAADIAVSFDHGLNGCCVCFDCYAAAADTANQKPGLEKASEALEIRFPEKAISFAERFGLGQFAEDAQTIPDVMMEQNAGTIYTSYDTDTGDLDQGIDALIYPYTWDTTILTYSFPDSPDDFTYSTSSAFGMLPAEMQAMAESAHAQFSAVAPFTFTELTGAEDRDADLAFALDGNAASAYAWLPSSSTQGGDSWYGQFLTDPVTPVVGSYDYHTVLHEVGHTLGLKHGHESSYGGALPYELNSMEFSVMTYHSYVGSLGGAYTNADGDFAQSLMMLDIAAIQRMYGANFEENSDDTTYTFDLLTGRMYVNGVDVIASAGLTKLSGSDTVFRTIWDGDGVDTYDFSNYATSLGVDLRPGEWVDLDTDGIFQRAYLGSGNFARGHIANALQYEGDSRSLIENAKGGSGDDWFRGNDADNTFWGAGGNDTFYDSAGSDTYHGDAGFDTLELAEAFASYSFEIAGSFIEATNGFMDRIADTVEQIVFSDEIWSWSNLYLWIDGSGEPANAAPNAEDDAVTTGSGADVSIAVLENDTDPDGDALTIEGFQQGTNGTVTRSGDTLIYVPNSGFEGVDSFAYTVTDETGAADTAIVTVSVEASGTTLTPFDDLVTFEQGSAQDAGGAVSFVSLDVAATSKMNGAFSGESGTDRMFEMIATGEDFDLSAALFKSDRGMATITVDAWDDGVLISTETFQAGARSATLETFGTGFEGIDRVVVTSDREILVDDIDITTYWVGEPPDPAPVPSDETIVIDFEDATATAPENGAPEFANSLSSAGFEFLEATMTSRSKGVTSGTFAAQSSVDDIIIQRTDASIFDFDGGWFTAVDGRKVDLAIEAWNNGELLGSETFRISDRRETLVEIDDVMFDNVDQVILRADGGMIADDLSFLI